MKYVWLRDVHLAIAAFCAPFLLLYAVSALQMLRPALAFGAPREHVFEAELAPGLLDPTAVHEALRARHDVRGELVSSAVVGEQLWLEIARPGRRYAIEVDTASGRVRVAETISSATRLLNRLHHGRGLWNREPAANAWGAAVIAVSLGLAMLVASGGWLWLLRPKERRIGLLVGGLSSAFALALLVSMRLAG